MKLVLDSNLLISAYTCDGKIRQWYLHKLELHCLTISPEIFREVEKNLRKGEFNLHSMELRVILNDILGRCDVVRIKNPELEKDALNSDWHLIALARQIEADFILTGDKRVLVRKPPTGTIIMTIKEFIEKHAGASEVKQLLG